MNPLNEPLGQADDGPVHLDLDKLTGSHLAVVANAGAGKSGLIRRLLEITYGSVQQIILDAEDEFYTLRERYPDYLIAGGEGGDAPATVANAEGLAKACLEHGFSLIAQINDLHSGDQERFIARFLETLMEAPREHWRPMLVVLDEAHRWAPQDGYAASSDAVKNLTSRGRKRGFTAVLATQRMAKIDKNVTGDVNNWFIGRVGQATDRRVAADALGFSPNSTEGRGLQTMEVRKFWCFGPATRPFATRFTVAETATTMVKAGQAKIPTPPAGGALKKIVAGLAKAAAATTPAATPAEAASTPPGVDTAAIRRAGYDDGKHDGYLEGDANGYKRAHSEAAAAVREVLKRFEAIAYDADEETGEIEGSIHFTNGGRIDVATSSGERIVGRSDALPMIPGKLTVEPATITTDEGTFTITPSYQKILDAVAWWAKLHGRPDASVPKKTLGFLVGMSPTAGGFANYLGKMRSVGLIVYPAPSEVALTAMGQTAAATPKAITPKQVQDMAMDRLPAGRLREILEIILEAYPERITKAKLAERIGMQATAGGFANYLGRLRSLDMIDYPVPNEVRASDLLFPGRR